MRVTALASPVSNATPPRIRRGAPYPCDKEMLARDHVVPGGFLRIEH